jgi:hypothetical protein
MTEYHDTYFASTVLRASKTIVMIFDEGIKVATSFFNQKFKNTNFVFLLFTRKKRSMTL